MQRLNGDAHRPQRFPRPARGNGQKVATGANGRQPNDTTPVYNPAGRPVGEICDGWLTKRVNTSRHQLQRPPAWATDERHLDQLEAINGQGVRLIDEAGRIWTAALSAFRHHGIKLNRGFGQQVALPLKFWQIVCPFEPQQHALFEVVECK
jgi:hypothetical protein